MSGTTHKLLAGLFITREFVYASSTLEKEWKDSSKAEQLTYLSEDALLTHEVVRVPVDANRPVDSISEALGFLGDCNEPPDAVAVAGYGPFKSLVYNSKGDPFDQSPYYGKVENSPTQGSLGGISLFETVAKHYRGGKHKPALVVHTDATSSAVGEYVIRASEIFPSRARLTSKHSIVFLSFTRGVGGSFLRGGNVHYGTLHSEMGQIPISEHGLEETAREPIEKFGKYPNLEMFASEDRLKSHLNTAELANFPNSIRSDAIAIQSYYIAQLCLSCALILSPVLIVVGGEMMKNTRLITAVRNNFRSFVGDDKSVSGQWFLNLGVPVEKLIQVPLTPESGAVGTLGLAASAIRHREMVTA